MAEAPKTAMASATEAKAGFLQSTFPVFFPTHAALTLTRDEFETFLKEELKVHTSRSNLVVRSASGIRLGSAAAESDAEKVESDKETVEGGAEKVAADDSSQTTVTATTHPFMKALIENPVPAEPKIDMQNKMFTNNGDIAFRFSGNHVVDLFYALEETISAASAAELLDAAWKEDPLMTLKIIFNARSIHLGKSSRRAFYTSLDWLSQTHPATCILNLEWLARPVIEKKVEKKEEKTKADEDEDDLVVVELEKDENDPARFDVRNGVAHGYFKDLLNVLVLTVNDKLKDSRAITNIEQPEAKSAVWDEVEAQKARRETRDARHTNALGKFSRNSFYRALHLHVARTFAAQLTADLKLLRSGKPKAARQISLCAKWAPSSKLFHDKHTFIVSSIAEIMHPQTEFASTADRTEYIRYAREAYRKDVSSLRKALGIVEREISANQFANIKYDRVPSLAMNQYAGVFADKDTARFTQYLDDVAGGKKQISGAVLLPSILVKAARAARQTNSFAGTARSSVRGRGRGRGRGGKRVSRKTLLEAHSASLDDKLIDGQWNTLVKRIKDSGSLENCMAVCDVSGSMTYPTFPDGTCPMDSAIGLSLLVAEVCKAPFGGAFITFDTTPAVVAIDLNSSLKEKVTKMEHSPWGGTTNFVTVFEDLILPLAIKHKIAPADMVKRLFVFSDMQFNQAGRREWGETSRWSSSFERIQKLYEKAGYEMPELVFWNLAGSQSAEWWSTSDVSKPVKAEEPGTALVSGYSQGMLKVFLDNGSFKDEEAEEEIVEREEKRTADEGADTVDEDDELTIVEKRKKVKLDPITTVKKAVSHKAYDMLKIYD